MLVGSTLGLPDGRTLAYDDAGDHAGVPVVYLHGTPDSRLGRPDDRVATDAGVRLLAVDRPGFGDSDVARLMADSGIVRNRAKVIATITNARATLDLREDPDGDLAAFVWSFQPVRTPRPRTMAEVPTTSPESLALSKALKRKGFVFVGPTTMYALMEAVGIVDTHLLGSHRRGSSGVWPH